MLQISPAHEIGKHIKSRVVFDHFQINIMTVSSFLHIMLHYELPII